MRSTRWLLLAALIVVIAAVGTIYFGRLSTMARERAPEVKPLPSGIEATAQGWHYSTRSGDCPVLEVRAKSFRQIKDPSTFDLDGVDLRLFHDCGKVFDHVESARAQFDQTSGTMFSEGEVTITMDVPAGGEANDKLVRIVSSGVKFETKSGNASTEREARFTFPQGDGKCVGAEYEPGKKELRLRNAVEINLKAKGPKGKPSKIETSQLTYLENDKKVVMQPWARLTRDTLTLNTAFTVAQIENGSLKYLEGDNAWGVQNDPNRKVEYQASKVRVFLNEDAQVTFLNADQNAHLVSRSDTANLDVKGNSIDLDFKPLEHESVLTHAVAKGKAVVQSDPVIKTGAPPADTRILRSETIDLYMREGGKEMERAETPVPGTVEFIPNRPAQPRRTLSGDKIWVTYGAQNQIRTFRTVNAKTRTDNPPKKGKPSPPTITSSEEFQAEFDPKTHQLARIDQHKNFRYDEGERHAQADRASLDQATSLMSLDGAARVTDPSGSTSADRILINQKSNDVEATGHVSSTRLPDKKSKSSSAMLTNDEPLQAKADRMKSTDDNMTIHYEGNAVAWQGANRIQANVLDIDRDEEVLKASGNVVSQFVDKPPKDRKNKKTGKPVAAPAQTVFTVVRAPEMTYTEETRTAVYKGGVVLNRPNLVVKSNELTAFLKDKDADSTLDKAFAEGAVTILQTAPGRTRTGTSGHAEYYADEEKIILEKGQPKFVDSLQGTTEGQKLTYFMNDDRLLVNGTEAQRSTSVIRRK